MKTLDCESIDSTYASMEEILLIERPVLEETLGNFDLDEACRRAGGKPGSQVLLDAVMKRARATGPTFDRTCWFHLTRSHPRNSFSKGILPLRDALPYLWGFLLMLLPEDFPFSKWYDFAENPPSGAYHRKLKDPACWGPFALLPREAGLPSWGFDARDPLGAPKIVEDICSAFQEGHDFDLLRAYRQNTRPCIVRFIDDTPSPGHLGIALQYLYGVVKGEQVPGGCKVDFDAEGRRVPAEHIQKVEFL
jgi:hypothetical protein